MDKEEQTLENIGLEEKISATDHPGLRIAARKFLEESCQLAILLPAHKRMTFIMHYSHGYSISEIADLCQVSPNTVTKRLKEITKELNTMRSCLEDRDDGKTDKSTKSRIEAYFRRERRRRNGIRKSKNSDKNI